MSKTKQIVEVSKARDAALKAFGEFRRSKAQPEIATDLFNDNSAQSVNERALAAQILGGVIQNIAYCDHIASYFSSIELKKLQPLVLDILRISIYQIVFLTKVPNSAAVNEGVNLAHKYANSQAAGYVNAVLRKVADSAQGSSLPDVAGEDEHSRLSVKYSHPEWLVREYCAQLGSIEAEKLLKLNNSIFTPITAQINTLRADTGSVIVSLASDGIHATEHEWLDNCIELHSPGKLDRLTAFKKGYIYIQDAASRLAAAAAGSKPGDFVIDACAAPGGKSFASAISMQNSGYIAACDINKARIKSIIDGTKRLGLKIVDALEKDASKPYAGFFNSADAVLADVPCSGFGIIRKKPDIRYKSPLDIKNLPEIQSRILSNLSMYVKPGGTMIYSTCTILKQENEEVVEAFLGAHPEYSAEGFDLPGLGQIPGGMITLWPHIHGTDGFFICRLVRNKRTVPMFIRSPTRGSEINEVFSNFESKGKMGLVKRDIKSMLPHELSEYFESIGEKAYRSQQVFRWIHSGARTFHDMTNLPEALRLGLGNDFVLFTPEIQEKQISGQDGTTKYLWKLADGNTVESVIMEYEHGLSICVSTQVGCRMGCAFCASAIGGLIRDLTASEMLDQILLSQADIGSRISNVVLMGIGEPLDNYDNVSRFIELVNHPLGINIGARHITLSTCGITENIDKLAKNDIQLSLAVSLHAPDDETRSFLMPINKASGVEKLLSACDRYFDATGRRVSYEYVLIDGVNDTPRHARLLAQKLRHSGSLINLIHLNNVPERAFRASPPENVKVFTGLLKQSGINFTVRRKLGNDIDAACGQLRGKRERQNGTLGNNR